MGAESLQLIQLPSQAVGLSAPAPPIVPIQSTLCPIGGGGRTLGAHAAPPPPTSEENEGEEDSKDDVVMDRRVVGNHQNGTCVLMLSWLDVRVCFVKLNPRRAATVCAFGLVRSDTIAAHHPPRVDGNSSFPCATPR